MIKTKCNRCKKVLWRSPSKVEPRNYCSKQCYSFTRNEELKARGLTYQFKEGQKRPQEWTTSQTKKVSGDRNYAWKGEKVSYRGLHQWVRRKKGKPTVCVQCGTKSEKPRIIQWANIDGRYRRNLNDFIALCVSCHKIHDLKMKSTLGEKPANQ